MCGRVRGSESVRKEDAGWRARQWWGSVICLRQDGVGLRERTRHQSTTWLPAGHPVHPANCSSPAELTTMGSSRVPMFHRRCISLHSFIIHPPRAMQRQKTKPQGCASGVASASSPFLPQHPQPFSLFSSSFATMTLNFHSRNSLSVFVPSFLHVL